MAARKNIERNQKELDSLLEDSYIKVDSPLSRRFSRIKWIRKGTLRKITHIINDGKDGMDYEDTVTARIAAAYWLNGYWGIRLLHWAVWRWMWHWARRPPPRRSGADWSSRRACWCRSCSVREKVT